MTGRGFAFIALVTLIHLLRTAIANQELFPNVTYEELESLEATCKHSDNCKEDRYDDNLGFYTCNCNEFCDQYDTCCVDSKYRVEKQRVRKPFSCLNVYGTRQLVFMVDSCDPSWNEDNSTEKLCTERAEEMDDLFLVVPVTSRKTGVTYKNYYCAVCNMEDDREELSLWNLHMESMSEDIMDSLLPDMHYIPSAKKWIVGEKVYDIREDKVEIDAVVPDKIKDKIHNCELEIISDCPADWSDDSIRHKCAAYMAFIRIPIKYKVTRTYRNAHCAICNGIDIEWFEDKKCPTKYPEGMKTLYPARWGFGRLISLYDNEIKCEDNEIYDVLAKKCRKVF